MNLTNLIPNRTQTARVGIITSKQTIPVKFTRQQSTRFFFSFGRLDNFQTCLTKLQQANQNQFTHQSGFANKIQFGQRTFRTCSNSTIIKLTSFVAETKT